MYQQNRIIKEVKKYCINKMNDFVYWSNNKIFFNEKKIIEDKISNINLYNKTLIYNVNFQYVFYYNLITKKNYKLKEVDGFSQFVNDNLILVVKNSDDYLKQYISLFDLQTKQKKWTIETYFGNGIIQDNHLYATCIKKRICKIDLTHPEQPLWQFDLKQFGTYFYSGDNLAYRVVRFIGIWNNLLLVQLENARLITLDIKTGILKKDLEINKTNPLETPLFYDQYTKMHLVGDKIIWLSNQTLIHIDLHIFKAEIIKEFYSKPRKEQWRFMHNTYFEGKIYFTADYAWQYVTPSYIGVMDANTGDVLWSQQLKNTGGLPEAPKITKDKLYIRTSTAMLHIFEKQDNEII